MSSPSCPKRWSSSFPPRTVSFPLRPCMLVKTSGPNMPGWSAVRSNVSLPSLPIAEMKPVTSEHEIGAGLGSRPFTFSAPSGQVMRAVPGRLKLRKSDFGSWRISASIWIAKFATTCLSSSTVTVQNGIESSQSAPSQPSKIHPAAGWAWSWMPFPSCTVSAQSSPQLMPSPATVPLPFAADGQSERALEARADRLRAVDGHRTRQHGRIGAVTPTLEDRSRIRCRGEGHHGPGEVVVGAGGEAVDRSDVARHAAAAGAVGVDLDGVADPLELDVDGLDGDRGHRARLWGGERLAPRAPVRNAVTRSRCRRQLDDRALVEVDFAVGAARDARGHARDAPADASDDRDRDPSLLRCRRRAWEGGAYPAILIDD